MSKQIKQMEMEALRSAFAGVGDLVVLSASGVDSITDNQIRNDLRKKKIQLKLVKNSLLRRVFGELGIQAGDCWQGPTILAWGSDSIAELSKELEAVAKKNPKIQIKTAVVDRQPVAFQRALTMPTRPEALGRIVGLALAPAARLLSQILGPASRVVGQVKSLKDREPESAAAAPAEHLPEQAAAAPAAPAE